MADPIGSLAATRIAPRAEEIDRDGCQLVNGEVDLPGRAAAQPEGPEGRPADGPDDSPQVRRAPVPGDDLHAAIEVMSRADASLMNFFGLQGGIAETINAFATDELKEQYLPGMAMASSPARWR